MPKVLAGGCFNRLHPGHIYFLRQAKKYGKLTVVVAHDAHNRKLHCIPAAKRKKALEALGIADKVVIGSDKNFSRVVEKEKPDIIVLGYDQKNPVRGFKGRIVRIGRHGHHNTTLLEARRQLLHAAVGIAIALMIFYLPKTHSALLLFTGIAGVLCMLMFQRPRQAIAYVGRAGEQPGSGVLFYLAGCLVAALLFDAATAAAAIMMLALGDSASTLVGSSLGKMSYWKKTVEGSVFGMLFALAGASFFIPAQQAFYAAFAFMFVEAVPKEKLDDNLLIPVVCGIVIKVA